MIDEIRFWDRELSPDEIFEHQYHSVSLEAEGLTSCWTFNETGNWQDLVNEDILVTPMLEVSQITSDAPINDWSSLDTNSLIINGGESEAITLRVDTACLELGEEYETNLILTTNDPEAEYITVPIIVSVVPLVENENEIIVKNQMNQNYPNPFNAEAESRNVTIIEYALREEVVEAEIIIYNIKGQKVIEFDLDIENSRSGNIIWDGRNGQNGQVGSGVYCYILKTDGAIISQRKMLLLH
jgi:hypothetical protein